MVLFQATPWDAVITDRVEGIQAEFKEVKQLRTRAVKAEEDLRTAASELERVAGQATALATERDALKQQLEELTSLRTRVSRKNEQLKALRKALRKGKKILDLTEERCYQMGYYNAVHKAHSTGLDHILFLEVGMSDPIGRVDVDKPLVISSGEDESLSD